MTLEDQDKNEKWLQVRKIQYKNENYNNGCKGYQSQTYGGPISKYY